MASMTARTLAVSGTRCSLPAFIRAAGTIQIRCASSISVQRMPSTSPVRAAVRIASSSARALTASRPRRRTRKAPTSG